LSRFCYSCGGDADEPEHWRRCDGQQGHVEAELEAAIEEPRAHARWTDPETSHDAAASLDPITLTSIQAKVLDVLQTRGPRPDVELVILYHARYGSAGESTIRTRRRELVDLGLVRDTGERVVLQSGRHAIVWEAIPS
jgi:hypothetical protein